MKDKPFLTVEEVAEKLRINEGSIRAWLRSGDLPGVKFGRQWRIRREDLDKFIQDQYRKQDQTKDRTNARQTDS